MNTLYAELVGTVVLAGLLGLGTGWMMQRARAARRLRRTVAMWEKRCDELRPAAGESARALEDQLRSMDQLLGAEASRTRELEAQLSATNTLLEKARGDSIRLNSQQAGIQQRLQRIIHEKKLELAKLAEQVGRPPASITDEPTTALPADMAGAQPYAGVEAEAEIEAYIDRLSDRGERTRHPSSLDRAADAAGDVADPATARTATRPAAAIAPVAAAPIEPTPDIESPLAPSIEASPLPSAEAPHEPPHEPMVVMFDDDYDDLDDTLDATAVIDMAMEHDVRVAPDGDDPLDATSQDPLLWDEDTIAFEEDTIAFDDATLARVRKRSNEA